MGQKLNDNGYERISIINYGNVNEKFKGSHGS